MVTKSQIPDGKAAFAARLNQALDEIGIPPKNEGRQKAAAELFELSQKGVRKWLEGEGLPETHKVPGIVAKINAYRPSLPPLRSEWLLFGEGAMRHEPAAIDAEELEMLRFFRASGPKSRLDLLAYAEFLNSREARVTGDLSEQNLRGSHYMGDGATAEMNRALQDAATPKYNLSDPHGSQKRSTPASARATPSKRRRTA